MEERIVTTGERDALFDNMRGVLIFLVVLGHMMDVSIIRGLGLKTVFYYIYFFHMPAFVFITGYFSKHIEKARGEAVRRFLVPYLVFCLLFGILDFFMVHPGHNFLTFYKFTIPQYGMWYLLAVFVWRLLAGDLLKVKAIVPVSLALGLVMPFFPDIDMRHSVGRIIGMLFFFVAGLSFRPEWIERVRKIPAWVGFFIMAVMVVPVLVLVANGWMAQEVIFLRSPYQNGAKVIQMLMRSGSYLIASIMIFAMFILMTRKKSFISQIGRNSLTVYIFHLLIVAIIKKLNILSGEPYLYFTLSIVISVVLAYLLSRMPVMRLYNSFIGWIGNRIFRDTTA